MGLGHGGSPGTGADSALPAREQALAADATLPLSRTVARSLHKLMAIKDEYEAARLYTDGRFQQQLRAQFDGDFALEFHLAPPLLSRARDGRPPRKLRIGAWLMPALGWLARARVLRGTVLDVFGRSAVTAPGQALRPSALAAPVRARVRAGPDAA